MHRHLPVLLAACTALALAACGRKDESANTSSGAGTAATTPAPLPAPAASPALPPAPTTAAPGTDAGMAAATSAAAGGGTTSGATATAGVDGAAVYNQACVACHGAGVAGAPKLGDKTDWAPRIAQGNDTLYAHAINGYQGKKGVMPPKGGAANKSDAEVRAAVDYMVAQGR